jgi:glycosyltransferase involved in cell wall biosynthesis
MADADLPDAVAVAYLHSNDVAYSWHFSWWQLFLADLGTYQRIRRGGIIAMECNSGQLVAGRNKAVQDFLDSDVPWVLWLDTDMGFQPDLLEQLMAAADPTERPIVGALCFGQRQLGPDGMGGYHTMAVPTVYDWAPVRTSDGQELEGFDIRWGYPQGALVRCSATGSAAILVHRSVYERIAEKYGAEWYHRVPAREGSMGEDLSFCMRATALDIPVHVHTGVRTTHAKRIWLAEADYLAVGVASPATEECAVLVPVLGRPEHAEPFMASLRASTGLATCYALCDDDDEEAAKAWKQAGASILPAAPAELAVNERGWPTGEIIRTADHPGTFAEKVNEGYRQTREPWLLLVGSDVRFHPGWLDQALAAAGDRYHVVGTNDLANPRVMAGEHATHPLIRRSYVDEVGASWDGPGVVAHEGYRHWFVDDEIVTAAKQREAWTPALASRVEHFHPLFGGRDADEVDALGQSHVEADKALFEARLARHR